MKDDELIKKKNIHLQDNEEGDTGDAGSASGGAGGQIEFRDFLTNRESARDDLLTGEEKRRLLSVHKDRHAVRVDAQKKLREERKQIKEGKVAKSFNQQGNGQQRQGEYKANPVLAAAAQFSGSVDNKVNTVPTEHIAETNNDKREELEYQYQLRNRPENTPRFNPKPQFNR
ncbi:MAG: hypothetical protein H0W64_08700 [Gammaproteobacteria bacterium]|nr:hypothetical protein [Gammaproteobacteria bacterium]